MPGPYTGPQVVAPKPLNSVRRGILSILPHGKLCHNVCTIPQLRHLAAHARGRNKDRHEPADHLPDGAGR